MLDGKEKNISLSLQTLSRLHIFASKDIYLSSSSVLHCDQGTIMTEDKKMQALLSVIYLVDTSHKKKDI